MLRLLVGKSGARTVYIDRKALTPQETGRLVSVIREAGLLRLSETELINLKQLSIDSWEMIGSIFGIVFGNRAVRFYIAWIYVMVVPFEVFRYPADWLNLRFLYLVSLGFCVLLTSSAVYASKLLIHRRIRRFIPYLVPAFYVGLTVVLVTKLDAKNERLAARLDERALQAPAAEGDAP